MTAMKRLKYRKRKETKRKYLQTCDQKVEWKKCTMANKTGRKNCDDVEVNAKAK